MSIGRKERDGSTEITKILVKKIEISKKRSSTIFVGET